jgi:hypothetical protein
MKREPVKAIVLAYHSHNIAGNDYATNDHVALASDLVTISSAGARVVPLGQIVDVVEGRGDRAEGTLVGLTFDDGPIFDFADFVHPAYGMQTGFLNILRDFQKEHPGAQEALHATSFVIASASARRAMERAEECGYPYVPNWLSDGWWPEAADSGLLGIGNHSWDHVHGAPDRIATRSGVRNDFTTVDNYEDADAEIRRAGEYINSIVDGRCEMFAFPFGHINGYLVDDYLPNRKAEHEMTAAFGAEGRAVQSGDSVWNIPRAICGFHWKSPEDLGDLLALQKGPMRAMASTSAV